MKKPQNRTQKENMRLHSTGFFSRIHPDYREHAIEQFADLIAGRISEFHESLPYPLVQRP